MAITVDEALAKLPEGKGAVVILSGGMDSTIALRFAVEKYGAENIAAMTFNYGQLQTAEIHHAKQSCIYLGVTKHRILNLKILGELAQGFSANVDSTIEMPTIQEVLGDPSPPTYVPYRNLILMSLAAAFAEVNDYENIICGLQVHDTYGYFDTTQEFVDKLNSVIQLNRKFKPTIIAPFVDISKTDEINLLLALDKSSTLLQYTMTCYNPTYFIGGPARSCGKCPSCAERLKAFKNVGIEDPILYVQP